MRTCARARVCVCGGGVGVGVYVWMYGCVCVCGVPACVCVNPRRPICVIVAGVDVVVTHVTDRYTNFVQKTPISKNSTPQYFLTLPIPHKSSKST